MKSKIDLKSILAYSKTLPFRKLREIQSARICFLSDTNFILVLITLDRQRAFIPQVMEAVGNPQFQDKFSDLMENDIYSE